MIVILAFSFNLRDQEPGLSNERIAREIKNFLTGDFCAEYSEPVRVLSQWEVNKALKRIGVGSVFVVLFHHVLGKYLDTKEVAEQMRDFMKAHKMFAPGVQFYAAAHQDHMPRVLRALKKLGINAQPMPTQEKIPYDPDGDQWWTRARWRFLLREWLIVRPLEIIGLV